MNHKCSDLEKTIRLYNTLDSIIIKSEDCRKIFEDAIQYEYGKSLDEYYENNINAIMVNNIRHNYSNYDELIKQVKRIHRTDNDYDQYKNCTLNKIAEAYPFLKKECERQKRQFDMVKIV